MTLARQLWAANADLAEAALAHPFVVGVAEGSLPREAFRGYVAQDAFFLESFARAYALALARCPDRDGIDDFADLIAGVRRSCSCTPGTRGASASTSPEWSQARRRWPTPTSCLRPRPWAAWVRRARR